MSENKKWIVLTTGNRSLNDICADLEECGFKVDDVMEAIGQIAGEGDKDIDKKVLKIPGIKGIYPSHDDIQIPPSNSDVTW